MTENQNTPFSNVCEILAELWTNYRGDEELKDFIEYNDVGLPLAFAFSNNFATPTELGQQFVLETFEIFLAGADVEDTGFTTLDEIWDKAEGSE